MIHSQYKVTLCFIHTMQELERLAKHPELFPGHAIAENFREVTFEILKKHLI